MKQTAAVPMILTAMLFTWCVEVMIADQITARIKAKQKSINYISATIVMTSWFGGENTTMQELMMTKPPGNCERIRTLSNIHIPSTG